MGVDDFANALAFVRDATMPRIRAFIATFGCANREQVFRNLQGFVALTEVAIPIYRGQATPLIPHPLDTNLPCFFGKNGFNDIVLPCPDEPNQSNIEGDLSEIVQVIEACPGPVDVLVTGPASTFAALLRHAPQVVAAKVDRVFVMGGAIRTAGNEGALDPETGKKVAEFNVYLDPGAFEELLRIGRPVYLVTWDQAKNPHFAFRRSFLSGLKSDLPASDMLLDAFLRYFDLYGQDDEGDGTGKSAEDPSLFLADPLVYLAYHDAANHTAQETVGTFVDMQVEVVTEDGPEFGRIREAPGVGIPIRYYELTDPVAARLRLVSAFGWQER